MKSFASRSALLLVAFAGQAASAQFIWTPTCNNTWQSVCQVGNCSGSLPLNGNNFGRTQCNGTPAFPGASDTVLVNAGTVDFNTSTAIAAMTTAAGTVFNSAGGTLNVGNWTAQGTVSQTGTVFGVGTFTNQGTWNESGLLRFNSLVFNNQSLVSFNTGSWAQWSGATTINNSGQFRNASGSSQVNTVTTVNSGTIAVDAGSLGFNNLTFTANPAGTMSAAPGTSLRWTNCNLEGTFNGGGAGDIEIAGGANLINAGLVNAMTGAGLKWVSGTLILGNGFTNNANAVFSIVTPGDRFLSAGTLTNNGSMTIDIGALLRFNGGGLTNNAALDWRSGDFSQWSGTTAFDNNGTTNKNTASAASANVSTNNNGTINVNAGSLSFQNIPFNAGAGSQFNVAGGATAEFANCTVNGTLAGTANGPLIIRGGLNTSGLTATVGGAQGLRWTTGTLNVTGGGEMVNQGQFTIETVGDRFLQGLLRNRGTTVIDVGASNINFNTGRFINSNGSTEIRAVRFNQWSGTTLFRNEATLRKTTPGAFTVLGVPFENPGSFGVEGGSVSLNGLSAAFGTGAVNVSPGASFTIDACGLTGRLQGNNQGSISFSNISLTEDPGFTIATTGNPVVWTGSTVANRTLTVESALTITGLDRFLNGCSLVSPGSTVIDMAGTLQVNSSSIVASGQVEMRSGVLNQWSGTTSINVPTGGTFRKTTASTCTILSVPTNIGGTLSVTEGTLNINTVALTALAGCTINASSGGTLNLNSCSYQGAGTFAGNNAGAINATGAMNLSAPVSVRFTGNGLSVQSSVNGNSLTNLAGGVLTFEGGDRFLSGTTVTNQGSMLVNMPGGALLRFNSGTLNNQGALELRECNINNWNGTTAINNSGTTRITTASNIPCNVTFNNTGTLSIERGSFRPTNVLNFSTGTTEFVLDNLQTGQINFTQGGVVLGGTIRVRQTTTPTIGQVVIMTCPNPPFTGGFNVDLPKGYGLLVLANEVRLSYCPADLNNDGAADFNDYLTLLNWLNTGDLRGDLNNDGGVDFNDYLEFLNLYNEGC